VTAHPIIPLLPITDECLALARSARPAARVKSLLAHPKGTQNKKKALAGGRPRLSLFEFPRAPEGWEPID